MVGACADAAAGTSAQGAQRQGAPHGSTFLHPLYQPGGQRVRRGTGLRMEARRLRRRNLL